MKRTKNCMVGALACVVGFVGRVICPTGEASAQAYFRDDFDGTAFKPNWVVPPPEHWDYEIGGGELTVKALKWPSQPFGNNIAKLSTPIEPIADEWTMTAGIEWEPDAGGGARVLVINTGFAAIDLVDSGFGEGTLTISTEFNSIPFSVSTIGYFTIGLAGAGSEFSLLYNGATLGSLPQISGGSISSLLFSFQVTYPWSMAPVHVDFVEVVPSAPTIVPIVGLFIACPRRRRM